MPKDAEKWPIDLWDRKLLYELDRNSSASLVQLAKRLKRSKQFVQYRMKKLEEAGIITGYSAIIDMSKLGYFTFRLYFKFSQMTENEMQGFVDFVKKNFPQVWTIAILHGKWDCAIFPGVKSIPEFHKIWDAIMLSYKRHIKAYNVSFYAPVFNFNTKFFLDKVSDVVVRVYGTGEKEDVDDLDTNIIEAYGPNVRQSFLEVAKKLRVSPDTVRKRIRALEKKKIIVGYKLGYNQEKLGYVGYRVDLQLISTARNKEIFEYIKMHPNIYQYNKSIGGEDFELEVVVKDLKHLRALIDELKTRFKDVINDISYFGFSVFPLLKYIPD